MTEENDIKKANLTTSRTDTETGCEGLGAEEDREKSLRALDDMYKRGLIPEDVYKEKRQNLETS